MGLSSGNGSTLVDCPVGMGQLHSGLSSRNGPTVDWNVKWEWADCRLDCQVGMGRL